MKVLEFKDNADYIRIRKNLTIKVNDLITADADLCGGLTYIESEIFGEVATLEDADIEFTFYISGVETKYDGFKELYNKLFKKDYMELHDETCKFVEKQVLLKYPKSIESLTTKQKIKLLREQIDMMPTFESDCGKTIAYRQWAVNSVLYSLGYDYVKSKRYNRLYEDRSSYGIELNKANEVYNQIKKENKTI
jgi:hypothetical protein